MVYMDSFSYAICLMNTNSADSCCHLKTLKWLHRRCSGRLVATNAERALLFYKGI
jgi:hypothetical protein